MSDEHELHHEEDFIATTDQVIRDRILHVLSIYPRISPTMLQVGIGTAISPKMWHPSFELLISQGIIKRETLSGKGATGRDQIYTIISLVTPEQTDVSSK